MQWHPDRAGEAGAARMIQLNVAYELVRSAQRPSVLGPRASVRSAGADSTRRGAGHWLPEAMRRALGRELLDALEADEPVQLVTPTATWASPSTLLAVTDRRLLWLLDDAVGNRVRSLRFRDTEHAEPDLARPRRRRSPGTCGRACRPDARSADRRRSWRTPPHSGDFAPCSPPAGADLLGGKARSAPAT
jgi:hypothetical protein